MFLISVSVYADVVRTWDVSGILKQKITIKGEGSARGKPAVIDQFVFGQDWSFSMIDLPVGLHTWGYVKKKFAVYLDNDVLETFWADTLEQMLMAEGIVADIQNITMTN
jgi:hypothetical protein